jgi:hypothetical protein
MRFDRRAIPIICLMSLGCIGWIMFLSSACAPRSVLGIELTQKLSDATVNYAAAFFAVSGILPMSAMMLGWTSANCGTDSGRALGVGLTVMLSKCVRLPSRRRMLTSPSA